MDEPLKLDYFYGIESEQFTFYRVPRLLIKDDRFKNLSSDAKLLYGLLLDRMSLSMRNGWVDEQNRTYIIYKIGHIADDLNCSEDKAARVLSELDSKKGIGLVEKVRRGLGKPDIIYVKNFVGYIKRDNEELRKEEKEPENPYSSTEPVKCGFKKPQGCESRNRKNADQEPADLRDRNPQECETGNRRDTEQEPAEYGSINKTNINNTDLSNNDSNHITLIWAGKKSIHEKIAEKEKLITKNDKMDEINVLNALIKKNIEYDAHMKYEGPNERELYDEMYQIIFETVCLKNGTVRIGGQDYPHEIVKSRFLKLTGEHLEYVRESMENNTTTVSNIKNYLITALYNAPATINHYYEQKYNSI